MPKTPPRLLMNKTKTTNYYLKFKNTYYSEYYFQYGSQCFVTHKVRAENQGRNLEHSDGINRQLV